MYVVRTRLVTLNAEACATGNSEITESTPAWNNGVICAKELLKCYRDLTRAKHSHERFVMLADSFHEHVELLMSVAKVDVVGSFLMI